MGNSLQSHGASPAIWDHTVLRATRHRWTRPALTPAKQAGTRFSYTLEGWKAELTLVLVIYRDSLPARRQSPILVATTWWRPRRELNRKSRLSTITPPSQCDAVGADGGR